MKTNSQKQNTTGLSRRALGFLFMFAIVMGITAAKAQTNPRTGLNALLTPDNCVLLLIDHQPFQFAALPSHPTQMVINNTVALAKTAKVFKVPTLLTTIIEERGGLIIKQIQDVFPDQKPLNRTNLNSWEDQRVVDWVKKTGKKKLVIAGLWTEVCVALPAIHAMGEGYEVYVVADASGGISTEAHEMAMHRLIAAGAIPITHDVFQAELQRDWIRTETANQLGPILLEHGGSLGTSLSWETQLLNTPKPKK